MTVSLRTPLLILLAVLALGRGAPASASTFTLSRVQVVLTAQAKSQVITVRNVSTERLRFQLDVFAWDQDRRGEMILAPTRDIVFFPPLFALAPGEQRNVRIGTVATPGAAEKTYRLFIEELPPPEGARVAPGQVTVRTRLGVPVFLRPTRERISGRVEGLGLREGRVSFGVRNTGNVHFVARTVLITGHGAAGETVLEGALEGWYVLAGGIRVYDLPVPEDKCRAIRAVSVEVRTAEATFTERLEAPPVACRP